MRLVVVLTIGGLALGLLTIFQFSAAAEVVGITGTPAYLPIIVRQNTPTPTRTPTTVPSSTPTRTPTRTLTPVGPTATRTATPTNTNPPSGVTILGNHSAYINSIGSLHIVGEVQNNSGGNIRFVKITADFYNGSHQFIGSSFTYTDITNLPSGQRTCFDVLESDPPDGYASYEFEAVTYSNTSEGLPNMAVLSPSGSVSQTGSYHLIGQVRNDNGTTVNYVEPVGTLYTANGTVADCGFTFVNSTHETAGQTSSFDMIFIGRPTYTDVASWRIQVDGDPQ